MLASPDRPSSVDSAMRAAAYAIDSVAEPLPALASTTSVPAFWMRSVSFLRSSSLKEAAGTHCGGAEDGFGGWRSVRSARVLRAR